MEKPIFQLNSKIFFIKVNIVLKTERLRNFAVILEPIENFSLMALKFFYSIAKVLQLATQRTSEKLARISLEIHNTKLGNFAYPSDRQMTQLENLSNKTKICDRHLKHPTQDVWDIEELFQLVMDTAQIEICDWDLFTNEISSLKNYQLLFSLDSNTATEVPRSFLEFVHPEDYASITQTLLLCIEEKIEYNDEFRVILPTGEIQWICARGKIHFSENGKATKVTLILKNIDDRYQAETSAINSEAKWRSLIQHSSEIVTIVGLNNSSDWTMKFVSSSLHRILGYSSFNLLGEDFLNLVHPRDIPYVITSLQLVLQEPDKVINIRYRYLSKTGTWYLIESSVSNQFNNSTILGIVLNSRVIKELLQEERKSLLENGSRATVKGVK